MTSHSLQFVYLIQFLCKNRRKISTTYHKDLLRFCCVSKATDKTLSKKKYLEQKFQTKAKGLFPGQRLFMSYTFLNIYTKVSKGHKTLNHAYISWICLPYGRIFAIDSLSLLPTFLFKESWFIRFSEQSVCFLSTHCNLRNRWPILPNFRLWFVSLQATSYVVQQKAPDEQVWRNGFILCNSGSPN